MKIYKIITMMLVVLLTTVGFVYGDSSDATIDESKIAQGIVSVSCVSDKVIKVMIVKDNKTYFYGLNNDGKKESFPLQLGNGDYDITVLENIVDTKYSPVYSNTVSLKVNDSKIVFLSSIQNINWDQTMKAILKSKELTKTKVKDSDKVSVIYNYVVKNYKYDYAKASSVKGDYVPVIDSMYVKKKGICYDYSSLLASMLRSAGIPTRLVKGYTSNVNGYHAWNEVYMKSTGKWVTVDTTFDAAMKIAKQKYAFAKKSSIYKSSYLY